MGIYDFEAGFWFHSAQHIEHLRMSIRNTGSTLHFSAAKYDKIWTCWYTSCNDHLNKLPGQSISIDKQRITISWQHPRNPFDLGAQTIFRRITFQTATCPQNAVSQVSVFNLNLKMSSTLDSWSQTWQLEIYIFAIPKQHWKPPVCWWPHSGLARMVQLTDCRW